MKRLFVTGTNTGVGKTFLTRGLARAAAHRGLKAAAVKPIETGCDPDPLDAIALARACGRSALAGVPGFYRARAALSPWAATLTGEPGCPRPQALVTTIETISSDFLLVEGAGGPLVPIAPDADVIDLAGLLDAQVLLVAPDELGCLSSTLTAAEAIRSRGLELERVILVRRETDPSQVHNAEILQARGLNIFVLDRTADNDDALARGVAPLLAQLLGGR